MTGVQTCALPILYWKITRKEYQQQDQQETKTDRQKEAEAILNALKNQEKINQKFQIKKTKSRKMEKDW